MIALYKRLRSQLPTGLNDQAYDEWVRSHNCVYGGTWGECEGDICADHVLGGYHGVKANGLLKVASCIRHNEMAESIPEMHKYALEEAIVLYFIYQSHQLMSKDL